LRRNQTIPDVPCATDNVVVMLSPSQRVFPFEHPPTLIGKNAVGICCGSDRIRPFIIYIGDCGLHDPCALAYGAVAAYSVSSSATPVRSARRARTAYATDADSNFDLAQLIDAPEYIRVRRDGLESSPRLREMSE
jgi:hypothetical protein